MKLIQLLKSWSKKSVLNGWFSEHIVITQARRLSRLNWKWTFSVFRGATLWELYMWLPSPSFETQNK